MKAVELRKSFSFEIDLELRRWFSMPLKRREISAGTFVVVAIAALLLVHLAIRYHDQ
jgi:hypothetical protein